MDLITTGSKEGAKNVCKRNTVMSPLSNFITPYFWPRGDILVLERGDITVLRLQMRELK